MEIFDYASIIVLLIIVSAPIAAAIFGSPRGG